MFNIDAAVAARAANPQLTPYDTGEMLEPQLHQTGNGASGYGLVDFDDSEGATVATVFAHPSTIDDDTTLIQIDTFAPGDFTVVLNGGSVYSDHDHDPEPDAGQEAARDALAAYDNWTELVGPDGHPLIGSVERADWVIGKLRAYVEAQR